jgi:hypothetical protein
MIASWLGHGAVVEQLLREGGDLDARSQKFDTALNIAALRREKDIARTLVQSNVKVYIDGGEYNILHTKRSELRSQVVLRRVSEEDQQWSGTRRLLTTGLRSVIAIEDDGVAVEDVGYHVVQR